MNYKHTFLACAAIFLCAICHANNIDITDFKGNFDQFVSSITNDFDNFRNQIFHQYTEFVRKPWKEFKKSNPLPKPELLPPSPPIIDEDNLPPIKSLPVIIKDPINPFENIPYSEPESQPQPLIPINTEPTSNVRILNFNFYGTPLTVRVDSKLALKPLLTSISEEEIANALEKLSAEANDVTISDCLSIRKEKNFSDWAYIQMLKKIATEITSLRNDAMLLFAYLYMQSGYKIRLAFYEKDLYILYASRHSIFNKPFFRIDGDDYYSLDPMPEKLYICQASFPQEKPLSLEIAKNQKFALDKSQITNRISKGYPFFATEFGVNKNLMDFYSTYPASSINDDMMTQWSLKANTPMDKDIVEQLYPVIKEKLAGKTQIEALNILLNYVQTGFEYQVDDKIWGSERAFFPEETLYYPFSDCEDRAILLTRLVRDILGNDCLLVYYPGHLACAIELEDNTTPGDYFIVDGKNFIIADPTYINACLGKTMKDKDNKTAKVILLE